MANDKMKFTEIARIPSWKLSTAEVKKDEKPKAEGAELRIDVKVPQLDTVQIGTDVMLCCKGKLTMRRVDENDAKTERYSYEVEVMEVAVMKSQKDLMNEAMQGA